MPDPEYPLHAPALQGSGIGLAFGIGLYATIGQPAWYVGGLLALGSLTAGYVAEKRAEAEE